VPTFDSKISRHPRNQVVLSSKVILTKILSAGSPRIF
jgi:hypothetical protein